jgi:hypothetical protein
MHRRGAILVLSVLIAGAAGLAAQAPAAADAMFRVFLRDGRAVPSYGESVRVGDRIVFALIVGAGLKTELQLMSLPIAAVDLERTSRYAESMRAAQYAATRGEADYAAMTAEVTRALDQLAAVPDPRERLALAEEAKRRLLAWSREHYSYRGNDIRQLAGLFDEVIADLRAAAGESRFTLDLTVGGALPTYDPVLPVPSLRESIALALVAAGAADDVAERTAVLRTAATVLADVPDAADLRLDLDRRLNEEIAADSSYAALRSEITTRALAAMRKGNVRAVDALRREVYLRDEALGGRRPRQVQALLDELRVTLERTQAHRLALDRHAYLRPGLLDYERRVRPTLAAFDGLKPILDAIGDMSGPGYDWLMRAVGRLASVTTEFAAIAPPEAVADVHATLRSALHMAQQACEHRRVALITASLSVARAGAAAATGAQLLANQARKDLVARLYPPTIQ